MSMSLFIFFALQKAPNVTEIENAFKKQQLPVTFTEKVDFSKHSGFTPLKINGEESGFYFLLEDFDDLSSHIRAIKEKGIKPGPVYSLEYGGHAKECAAAFYTATALVAELGGIAFEPQGGTFMNAAELKSAAEMCLQMEKM